jgi:hypothetical protein
MEITHKFVFGFVPGFRFRPQSSPLTLAAQGATAAWANNLVAFPPLDVHRGSFSSAGVWQFVETELQQDSDDEKRMQELWFINPVEVWNVLATMVL